MKKISLITLATASLLPNLLVAQEAKPKNVLFIAIDDLKPLLGSYGYDQMVTPNIDRIASNGVLFENAHTQQAVSGPSRASLLTGMTPDYTGVRDLRTRMRNVNPDILALPEYFRQNNYQTVATGKIYDPRCVDKSYDLPSWSIPYKESSKYVYPEEWGEPALSYYVDMESKAIVAKYEAEAREKGIKNLHAYVSGKFKPATECVDAPDNAYMDGQIANNAIRYMEELSQSDEPFFLAVGFKRPHLPFAAPKKYWDLYQREEVQLADYQKPVKDGVAIAYHNHGELQSYTDIPELKSFSDIFSNLIDEDKQRELIHGYYASVSFIDAQVGRVMAKLDELGLAENTIVIVWGDHGWHLGDHALWCKHSNFEQATHVPMIISTPEGEKGRYSYPVEFLDVFPTLCDAAGLSIPEHLQGTSLVPAMKDLNHRVKDYAVSQFDRGKIRGYSLRGDRYRLTVWMKDNYSTDKPFDENLIHDCELYDYKTDPNETRNLYRKKSYKKVKDQLMDYFKDYVAKQNVALKSKNNKKKKVKKNSAALVTDGSFNSALDKNWMTFARKASSASFDVISAGRFGENTLRINVKNLGENEHDIGLKTKKSIVLDKGQTVEISFLGTGKNVKVILQTEDNKNLVEPLELGSSDAVHRLEYKIKTTGKYFFKIHFLDAGDYHIDDIQAIIE